MSTEFRRPPAIPTDGDTTRRDCSRFEEQLGAWMEHDLAPAEQRWMTAHRAACAGCDTLVRDLEQLVRDAVALPPLSPSRDLWPSIEARLEAPVVALPLPVERMSAAETRAGVRPGPHAASHGASRTVHVARIAAAAALLVAVSSGITWQLARARGEGAPRPAVATPVAATPVAATPVAATPVAWSDSLGGIEATDPHVTFEREIVALRRIVDERFTELDPATVTELRRNLAIIDQAISDSRQALARDPRSGVVSSQLDRALQAKLELLRRVALL